MDREELTQRTKKFAHRCVKLALALPETALGRHIQGQIISVQHLLRLTIEQLAYRNLMLVL